MRRLVKIAAYTVGGVALLGATAFGTAYSVSESKLSHRYEVPEIRIATSTDPLVIERGRHLVTSAGSCGECHAEDLGGKAMMDEGPIGRIVASNLTSGAGGIGRTYSDADYAAAIRHGVRPDRTSLLIMPSDAFTYFTDADLSAIVSYLRHGAAPVDRELPRSKLLPLGRALLAANQLPMLSAELTPKVVTREAVEPAPTAAYGAYLAEVAGCRSCHGPDLVGGKAIGGPDGPVSANLTAVGIGTWTEADFVRALREGRRPDGTGINEMMPWRFTARMTDDELHALWLYIQTVPAKETPAAK